MCEGFFPKTICLFLLIGPYFSQAEQHPGDYWTDTEAVMALLDEVMNKYAVDASRVYLTGHSMGGFGTWYLAYKRSEKFAAIAPMSSLMVTTAWATRLREMPIWAFHGEKDELVPVSDTQDLIHALTDRGKDVRLTILPNRDHYILDVYENQDLYSWFLRHKRETR
jgi:predicted peptidase